MAEAAAPAPAEGAAPDGGKQRMLILALTLGGAIVGGLLGSFVVAPRIIARQHPAVAASDSGTAEAAPADGEGGEGREGEGGAGKKLVELSNIIVNPAGSQGTRFLMTSVAISVASEDAQKLLSERQVELRDRITSILETQTMAQLTAPGERDSLKVRIGQVVSSVVGPKVPLKVYLPQFVIQ